jgi:uncharacterized protein GlcG (DUF336 family)
LFEEFTMKLSMYAGAALLAMLALPSGAEAQGRQGQPPQPQPLTYEIAMHAADAAEAVARQNGWNMVIVITDAQGVPIYLKRMTGAQPRIYDFAMGKIRTVIGSGLSTKEYADRVAQGSIQAIPDAVALEGGFPIVMNGQTVGAIAASGVRPDQDAQVAQAGLAAIASHAGH